MKTFRSRKIVHTLAISKNITTFAPLFQFHRCDIDASCDGELSKDIT